MLGGCLLVIGGDLDGTSGGATDGGSNSETSTPGTDGARPPDAGSEASIDPSRPPPSCLDGGASAHCGPIGSADCCATVPISGGTFARSYDGIDAGNDDKKFVATVSPFRLDTYEVTVGRFRAFVAEYPKSRPAAGAGKNPHDSTDPGWDAAWSAVLPAEQSDLEDQISCDHPTWTKAPGPNETKPIVCVTWYVAYAFCIWDGGRLPTEAEWNFVAAGGAEQRVYPWSVPPAFQTIDSTYGVYASAGPSAISAVGSKSTRGDGKWGHADLGGNVWEWMVDANPGSYSINPCNDCADRSPAPSRSIRGGAYDTIAVTLQSSFRSSADPTLRGYDVGIRCAR